MAIRIGVQMTAAVKQMVAAALLAGLILGLGASSASAHTTITCEPCTYPYQQWVDEAKVPTPDVTITVGEDMARCGVFSGGCTDSRTYIEMQPEEEARKTFDHELGHVWDSTTMQPWQRSRYLGLIRRPHLPWTVAELEAVEGKPFEGWSPRYPAQEFFADTYSLCARWGKALTWTEVGLGMISKPALEATCKMIRRG
jgi:hypothetical protein